jgi:hypothetical protein
VFNVLIGSQNKDRGPLGNKRNARSSISAHRLQGPEETRFQSADRTAKSDTKCNTNGGIPTPGAATQVQAGTNDVGYLFVFIVISW